ncbi:TetR/AcrR family transcriptional regulator [Saccharothrix coeruleofusca]|uniref:TetR family transcriptional regulator n=1 Tax=Saccharothrix coeruleofusca TaxID=33919 RepID=A0A918AKD5_9PSEU|nr:TetR/AcrR family transcriptional regulator [Saccharothrix coeruleofusca]MBP2338224.1 AcrR family transcriptional regulator [Saccharothrix coeruleofusca]GGP49913.1 TetR family transcriptional regulator [Saccharothrix coeruleofusca]
MATARKPRADAQRNRDAILAAARETFEAEGVLAPLDGIALRAGVGNATLYRNFPTRDDLLAAVIADSIAKALSEADELSRTLTPRAALAEWLVLLTWRLRIWHDLPYCLATALRDVESPMRTTSDPLLERTDSLLDAARAADALATPVTASEVYELVLALSWAVDRFDDDAAAARKRVVMATAGIFTRP